MSNPRNVQKVRTPNTHLIHGIKRFGTTFHSTSMKSIIKDVFPKVQVLLMKSNNESNCKFKDSNHTSSLKNIKVLKELHDFNVRDSVFPDKDHSKNLFIIQQLENGDGTREERKKKKQKKQESLYSVPEKFCSYY